jgi:hypothetical protein
VLATDGGFGADDRFIALPAVPEGLLAEGFRRAVLWFLVKKGAITEELRAKLLGWRYCGGFTAHNRVCVTAEDREGRMKLAGYMIRAPMSLEKMNYDATTGTVIYRSKMHLGLKRNFQVMPGAEVARASAAARAGSLRAPGALRWLVLQPRARRAGKGAQGAGLGDPAHGSRSGGERVRHPC